MRYIVPICQTDCTGVCFTLRVSDGGPQYWAASTPLSPLCKTLGHSLIRPVDGVFLDGVRQLPIARRKRSAPTNSSLFSFTHFSLSLFLSLSLSLSLSLVVLPTTPRTYAHLNPTGTDFQGGVRTAAFVAGGLLPASVRGTVQHGMIHIADWYRTFGVLAGVLPAEGVVPGANYNGAKVPPLDGLDMWPLLTGKVDSSPRHGFPLSQFAIIQGQYK